MPTKKFALEPGGPKHLELRWGFRWKDFTVCFEERVIGHVEGGVQALRKGAELALPNGSLLRIRLVSSLMGPQLALHVADKPVPGSAAVPLPKWSYAFIGACAIIPVLTVGGAVPAAIGFGGAAGVAAVARDETKGSGLRLAVSASIAAACWVALLLFLQAVGRAQR
jgi:hypothetical protein